MERDERVRLAAFEFLREATEREGQVLPRALLLGGFTFEGQRVPLMGPKGIFKPAVLPEMPLSITTVPHVEGRSRPYDDAVTPDGLLQYRYRGSDTHHPDNAGLRLAMRRGVPLVYFFGIVRGQYLPIWPVYLVGDQPHRLTFTVAVDDQRFAGEGMEEIEESVRRSYVTRLTMQRLHQFSFRQRVLRAYQESCAMCHLRHVELLEAAHILPDGHPQGEPIVPNGVALCKLHHAAFDSFILGVRPDLIIEVRPDILDESDGPMLQHGLKEMHGLRLSVPRSGRLRPREAFLEERYELFRGRGEAA